GMTFTTTAITLGDTRISVESTEGFPPVGVARVGSELVEYVLSEGALVCQHNIAGPMAGFGGRMARSQRLQERDPASVPVGVGTGELSGDHPAGTLVEHYGYSLGMPEPLPQGQASLSGPLGPFRVARVVGLGSGSMDAISIDGTAGVEGLMGIKADNLDTLELVLADNPSSDADGQEALAGFSTSGGYALLVQGWSGTQFGGGRVTAAPDNTPIGGVEVIRYSGTLDSQLVVARRGAQDELGVDFLDGARAFLIDYGSLLDTGGNQVNELMERSLYCVPISIPVSPASMFPADLGAGRMVQLTHTEAGELTEWVRYNIAQASFNQLVRLDQNIAENIVRWFHADQLPQIQSGLLGGSPGPMVLPSTVAVVPTAQGAGSQWKPQRGEAEELDLPLTNSIADNLRFRGVADTYPQIHAANTAVLPTFRVDQRVDQWPGAQDPIFLTGGLVSSSGMQTNLIHRAYASPITTIQRDWQDFDVSSAAAESTETAVPYPLEERGLWVALATGLSSNIVAASGTGASGEEDQRLLPRIAKFPSGERPSSAGQVVFGGDAASSDTSLPIPEVVIDEVVFQDLTHGAGLASGMTTEATMGSGLVLGEDLTDSQTILRVRPDLFTSRGRVRSDFQVLNTLPHNVGLARIGDEIVCYINKDFDTGFVELAAAGRGLLGTTPSPHSVGTVMYPLTTIPVSLLDQEIEGDSSEISVLEPTRFPNEGTLLIGQELLHYTGKLGRQFVMPRGSLEVGLADAEGGGLFRGRFGTAAQAAAVGTPVIFFPWRYWDRWQERSDVPELAYLGLRVDQPGALFEDVFYEAEPIPFGGVAMGTLLRLHDALPWDGDPEETPGLFLLDKGTDKDQQPWILDAVSDALEARFFVDYEPGCFDLNTGSKHGWKYTPRLKKFGVGYEAPGEVLRSVDQ
ncbi:MAG: hypothetical protein P1V35_01460, partial [Planctomycetota bacterium]|nr:hypothetical protein [Planctomycetota bacterium]